MLPKQGHGRIYINIGGVWGKDFIAIDLIAKDFIALSTRHPHDKLRLCADRVTIMAIMRTLIVGTASLGCLAGWLTGPAFAQAKGDSPAAVEMHEKKKAAEAIDREYKSTLERVRKDTPEVRADPWQNLRGADKPKAKR